MDKTIYSITLGDGKVIEDLTMNGNNFVSQAEVTEDDFTDLSQVTITGSDGTEEILKNVELNQIAHYSDGWYFILRELTPEEIRNNNNEAQIFYTAIATDTLMED
ncbi:hypothetical protein [Butyrivibrio sp.]|uniref:hypothetical protein n=1 Tax=Butyrivibrio sp. TaxID=28121 RepID=UPI0025B879CC|nr:hypothetical protein [Butyrivibrio sp.]MBQ9302018.1 hypothetical protein [Butyrivibrio sp.]